MFSNTVVPHQDSTFLYTSPESLVGFWIALDNATIENGCLCIIPGSHKTNVHRRMIRNPNKGTENDRMIFQGMLPEYDQSLYVPITVEKCKPYVQNSCYSI